MFQWLVNLFRQQRTVPSPEEELESVKKAVIKAQAAQAASVPPGRLYPSDLSLWVEEQKKAGTPLWEIWKGIMAKSRDDALLVEGMELARKIEDVVVNRNMKGTRLEKSGNENRAIPLYEANVRDHFDGSHPYERLRILYAADRRYSDAIRVCEESLRYCNLRAEDRAKSEHFIEKYKQNQADRNKVAT
jgi:hypothetical protein